MSISLNVLSILVSKLIILFIISPNEFTEVDQLVIPFLNFPVKQYGINSEGMNLLRMIMKK